MHKVKLLIMIFLSAAVYSGLISGEGTEDEVKDLGTIVVTGTTHEQYKQLSTRNIHVITSGEIASTGAVDMAELLDSTPSVDILEYGSFGSQRTVHLRGHSANQVLVLIDGRPANNPLNGIVDLSNIGLANVERVEILRGPASSIYGANAIGGVINIITKKGHTDMQTKLSLQGGSFKTYNASLVTGNELGKIDYLISYEYLSLEGHRANSDFVGSYPFVSLGYDLNETNGFKISGGYAGTKKGSPGLITNVDLDDMQRDVKSNADLTYTGSLLQDQKIIIKAYNNYDKLAFIETREPLAETINITDVQGINGHVSQVVGDIATVSVGGAYADNELRSGGSGNHQFSSKSAYLDTDITYYQDNILKLGVRWDDYSNFGDEVSKSASIHYFVCTNVKLHALAAESFRIPTFNDLYWPVEDYGIFGGVEGNSQLKPETAATYEGGISGYFKFIQTDVTYFRSKLDDLIEWTVDNAWWWRPTNIASAIIEGIETEVQTDVGKYIKIHASHIYQKARNDQTDNWLIYRPHHIYKAGVRAAIDSYALGLQGIYKTKRYANETNTAILGPNFLLNGNISYKINDIIRAHADVKNIFDRSYEEQRDYPLPGRAWYGGIDIVF
ncbi:MAG: TonB-dependent receptor [bacterium]